MNEIFFISPSVVCAQSGLTLPFSRVIETLIFRSEWVTGTVAQFCPIQTPISVIVQSTILGEPSRGFLCEKMVNSFLFSATNVGPLKRKLL